MPDHHELRTREVIDEQVRRNMELFKEALSMFAPFETGGSTAAPSSSSGKPENADEISQLKEQLSAIQAQLDKMTRGPG